MGMFLSTAPRVVRALAEQCVKAPSTSTDGKTGEDIPITQKHPWNDTFGTSHQAVGSIKTEECLMGISCIEIRITALTVSRTVSKMVPTEGQ